MTKKIAKKFQLLGRVKNVEPVEGNTNQVIVTTKKKYLNVKYLIEKVETNNFEDFAATMETVEKVTAAMTSSLVSRLVDATQHTLTIVRTKKNELFYTKNNEVYRMKHYVEGTTEFERKTKMISEFATVLGNFQRDTASCDLANLDNVKKVTFKVRNDYSNFVDYGIASKEKELFDVSSEVQFVLDRRALILEYQHLLKNPTLPVRLITNSDNFGNVTFDALTSKGLCLNNLDTLYKSTLLVDLVTSLYRVCVTTVNDEIRFNVCAAKAFLNGYITAAKETLAEIEVNNILLAFKVVVLGTAIELLSAVLDNNNASEVDLTTIRRRLSIVKQIENFETELLDVINAAFEA